jgi:metallophosphoesterase (TIGR00282 family)
MAKILFIGDIVGKPGRKALREVLPMWKQEYHPDAVIVNVENIAHGKGVTVNTMTNIEDLGIDCYTSGNHVFDKEALSKECFEKYPNLIHPVNYPENLPGHGYFRFSKNEKQYLVINLNGTVFFDKLFDGQVRNPFLEVDKILEQQAQKGDIILIDFHAEATSEKIAFGFYCDGRVTAILGTHTHVPTADARILPSQTAYITDVGMTGPLNSVIGVKKENALAKFLDPNAKFKNEPEEEGIIMINGVLIETNSEAKAVKIEKLYKEI